MDTQPNPTLYIQNLDTKISKDDIRRLLYSYFSSYGKVLDVVSLKNDKMRGQAFVVFKDLATSTAALRKEDGRVFAGKALKIQYARGKSYATISDESGKEALYQYRLGIVKNPEASKKLTVSGAGKALAGAGKRDRANGAANGDDDDEDDEEDGDEASAAKKARTEAATAADDDEEMQMSEEEESDDDAPGPAPAAA